MEKDVLGAVFGLAVADALGVPVEFKSREYLLDHPVTGMLGYGTYNQPPGTWSDDTGMTLCLLDSLSAGLDYTDIMNKFVLWFHHQQYTPHGTVFDIGGTTQRALKRFMAGAAPLECGGLAERDNGNGALMRILPLAFFLYDKYGTRICQNEGAMEVIHNIASLTHGHPRNHIACGIYLAIALQLIDGGNPFAALEAGINSAQVFYRQMPEYGGELHHFERLFAGEDLARLVEGEIKSSGYVVDTLEAALWCLLNTDNYRECVLKAVNLGDDTDTVGAVAGGLGGLYYGLGAIPEEWRRQLPRKEFIADLCRKFAASLAGPDTDRQESLLIHPQYKELLAVIKELKGEITDLLGERDELLHHICKNIRADYMVKIGSLEYKVFQKQCEIRMIRRKIELIQRSINRQEEVCLAAIEKQLEKEYEAYKQELARQARQLAEAIELLGAATLTEKEGLELKKLYRNVVKKLHPDINPGRSPQEEQLYIRALKAYRNGDIELLRTIEALVADIATGEAEKDSMEELIDQKNSLAAKIEVLKKAIKNSKESFPYNQKEFLLDEGRVRARQEELQRMLSECQDILQSLNEKLKMILGDNNV